MDCLSLKKNHVAVQIWKRHPLTWPGVAIWRFLKSLLERREGWLERNIQKVLGWLSLRGRGVKLENLWEKEKNKTIQINSVVWQHTTVDNNKTKPRPGGGGWVDRLRNNYNFTASNCDESVTRTLSYHNLYSPYQRTIEIIKWNKHNNEKRRYALIFTYCLQLVLGTSLWSVFETTRVTMPMQGRWKAPIAEVGAGTLQVGWTVLQGSHGCDWAQFQALAGGGGEIPLY